MLVLFVVALQNIKLIFFYSPCLWGKYRIFVVKKINV